MREEKEAAARVVRIFPDDASLVRLVSAPAIERNQKWMERRYLTTAEAPPSETGPRKTALAPAGPEEKPRTNPRLTLERTNEWLT